MNKWITAFIVLAMSVSAYAGTINVSICDRDIDVFQRDDGKVVRVYFGYIRFPGGFASEVRSGIVVKEAEQYGKVTVWVAPEYCDLDWPYGSDYTLPIPGYKIKHVEYLTVE